MAKNLSCGTKILCGGVFFVHWNKKRAGDLKNLMETMRSTLNFENLVVLRFSIFFRVKKIESCMSCKIRKIVGSRKICRGRSKNFGVSQKNFEVMSKILGCHEKIVEVVQKILGCHKKFRGRAKNFVVVQKNFVVVQKICEKVVEVVQKILGCHKKI